ncbi:hypothetical protein BU15DRAFT_60118 [Melanogaster broomeanus]|nr:hypothetical protein BU15DRAFT_60118 [Melanogaster broomeanus]
MQSRVLGDTPADAFRLVGQLAQRDIYGPEVQELSIREQQVLKTASRMFKAPIPPCDPLDKTGYDTVVKRWPIITTTNLIGHVHRLVHDMTMESQRLTTSGQGESGRVKELQFKITEGKTIVTKASRLKYRMGRDQNRIPQDGNIYVDAYNPELAELATTKQNTWFTAPWLYAESRDHNARGGHRETQAQVGSDKLTVLFGEVVQMRLWWVVVYSGDVIVGKEAQQARKAFIIKDDQETVWEYIKTLAGQGGRCDFVLDNGTLASLRVIDDVLWQLFTDFVFADFLVTYTPYFSKVVFHYVSSEVVLAHGNLT